MLSILDISKRFGAVEALAGCSFPVERGTDARLPGTERRREDDDDARLRRAGYALVRFAGRVCAHGLLHGGSQLGIHAAWRLARQH